MFVISSIFAGFDPEASMPLGKVQRREGLEMSSMPLRTRVLG